MHGYFTRILEKDQRIDHNSSNSWIKNQKLTSHFEGYISAIQDVFDNKRAKDVGKELPCYNKCRLCRTNFEGVTLIISSCPYMPGRYYLPMTHGMVAKTLLKEVIRKNYREMKPTKEINEPK